MKGFITALIAIAILVAPRSVAAQAELAGTYNLTRVGEQVLPVVADRDDNCIEHVTAARLTLNADGTWTLNVQERSTCGTAVETDTEDEKGKFTVSEQTVQFVEDDEADDDDDSDDPDELDVDEIESATVNGNTLRVRITGRTEVLIFEKA